MKTLFAFGACLMVLLLGDALYAGCQVDGTRLTQDPPGGGAGWWEYRGAWNGGFTGTPIAPHYFLTAAHVGGAVGLPLTYRGADYVTTARWTQDDLALYRVARAFPAYAPLYEGHAETGKALAFYGRGQQVGAPVVAAGLRRGWRLGGPSDGAWVWGRGVVAHVEPTERGGQGGPMLYFDFDARVPHAIGFTTGDSGGAGFIRDGTVWKLAGIARAIDGPYTQDGKDIFNAALFDKRGLYEPNMASRRYVLVDPSGPEPVPGENWLSRVSAHAAWLHEILGADKP